MKMVSHINKLTMLIITSEQVKTRFLQAMRRVPSPGMIYDVCVAPPILISCGCN